MKRLGKYLHTTPQGLAILRLSMVPQLGWNVVSEKGQPIGQVADVFGPIAAPYCAVRLSQGSSQLLSKGSTELYLSEKRSPRRGSHGRSH